MTVTVPTASPLASLLLRRSRAVYVPTPVASPADPAALAALELDLLDRGHLLAAPLRAALSALDPVALGDCGATLLATVDEMLGAHVRHVPAFRGFPETTPADTTALWVARVFSMLLQTEDAPCVLCGGTDVHPVNPCAHLICRSCFDGADHGNCPICHARIDETDPFLPPSPPAPAMAWTPADKTTPLRLLRLGEDQVRDAAVELAKIAARDAAPSPADVDDIQLIVTELAAVTDIGIWLPPAAGRQTKALIVGTLLADPRHRAAGINALGLLCDTATDVARALYVAAGAGPDLAAPKARLGALPRVVRRSALVVLERIGLAKMAEDMPRNAAAWRHLGERLHPFEHAARYPQTAAAFALVRGTEVTGTDAVSAAATTAAATHPHLRVEHRLRYTSTAARIEAAIAGRDVEAALTELAARPGEMLRRLDQLARLVAAEPGRWNHLGDAARLAAEAVSPAVLLAAAAELRNRGTAPVAKRVFLPAGKVANPHTIADLRPPLPGGLARQLVDICQIELVARASTLRKFDVAVIDEALADVTAPFTARSAAKALVSLPRGSAHPLPDGKVLRLFCHWMEPDGERTDLDLSVVCFDAGFDAVGQCSYTNLRFAGDAAIHSGDLTSAPAPLGSTEFVDLDVAKLRSAGVRYVLAAVLSYNSVPFDQLPRAFAGVMVRPSGRGQHFDGRTVEQRFDLAGPAKVCVPLLVDLDEGRARWLDVNYDAGGDLHSVHSHGSRLAALAADLETYFAAGSRASMWDVATLHALGRADHLVVRTRAGRLVDYTDRDHSVPGVGDRPVLAMLVNGDLTLAAGSEVYAAWPGACGGDIEAADVVSSLRRR